MSGAERRYPAGWPRCHCGAPVLDGHLTCGRVQCDEAGARVRAQVTARQLEQGPFNPGERDELLGILRAMTFHADPDRNEAIKDLIARQVRLYHREQRLIERMEDATRVIATR